MSKEKIAALNDLARKAPGMAGRLVQTIGIRSLPYLTQCAIRIAVGKFDTFTPDNDPHGEHDFGAFAYNGIGIMWKIDYYDPELQFHTEDPANPSKTVRVLTIMLASEY